MSLNEKKRCHYPSFKQWCQISKVLTTKEKIAILSFFVLFLGSFSFLLISFFSQHTKITAAQGGKFIEGVIGQPRFINPIYTASNDVDRDLVELIYSGLMKFDLEGKIVPDLAQECKIQEGGTVFECYLKEGAVFHDGKKVTADDVIFTVKTIQNPDFKSYLRADWLEIEVEKISENGVRFKLKNPYAPFFERLTLKILPKNIWKDVSSQNFPFSPYNLNPIGSGPYQFESSKQDPSGKILSLDLKRFTSYYGQKPYLSKIYFRFFYFGNKEEDRIRAKEELIKAAQKKEIQGYSISSFKNYDFAGELNLYSFSLPRYFAVFFNPSQNELLAKKGVRQAFNYGTDKEEILGKIFLGEAGVTSAKVVHSPILPEIYKYSLPANVYEFNLEKAENLLKEAGFKKEAGKLVKVIEAEKMDFKTDLKQGSRGSEVKNLQECLSNLTIEGKKIYQGEITGFFGQETKEAVMKFQEKYASDILEPLGLKKGTGEVRKGTRNKLNEVCLISPGKVLPFKISLTTVKDPENPMLELTAELLKTQWEKLGIEVEVKVFPSDTFKEDIIRKRDYEALIFGEVLGQIPDPFPFWHSSQKKDPGLNLAGYENKDCDKLLEEARQSLDEEKREKTLEKFQEFLIGNAPAIFLYNPEYLYFVSKEIKGIETGVIVDPSKRFINIENWYIKTKRAWQ